MELGSIGSAAVACAKIPSAAPVAAAVASSLASGRSSPIPRSCQSLPRPGSPESPSQAHQERLVGQKSSTHKVMESDLQHWYRARQDEAMTEQYSSSESA